MRMIALRQPFLKYQTRRLLPGDEFDVKPGYGRILKKLGRAMDAPPPPKEVTELDALRAKATALGMTFDGRWGAKRLRSAIDRTVGGK